jgi:hypothetical protein
MKFLFLILIFISSGKILFPQENNLDVPVNRHIDKVIKDVDLNQSGIFKTQNLQQSVSIGGIFISPFFGFVFPMRSFNDNSNTGVNYGIKLEFAHTKIYPFVIGAFFEQQKHKGAEEYKALHRLTNFQTDITSIGGGVDLILNKYIRSNFTIPFIILEGKYMNVSRIIEPAANNPGIAESESLIGYTAGLGFTLYIFDLNSKYTFAKDLSNLSINIRIRYPIVKF